VKTGSVILSGLPDGNWTINPGGITGIGTNTTITGLEAGIYNFTVTNSTDCNSEKSVDIVINEADAGTSPIITTKYNNDLLICYNLDNLFVSYQWYKDLKSLDNDTLQYYQTHREPGNYFVIAKDKNGCKNSSNSIIISGKKSMTVYPNPASSSISLKIENLSEGGGVISIYNAAGVKIREYNVETNMDNFMRNIPVHDLERGIYIVKVMLKTNEIFLEKIVVIK
jgi:hypothetical protein